MHLYIYQAYVANCQYSKRQKKKIETILFKILLFDF